MQVPNDSLGGVIGRQGSRINEIRNLSGARINIDSATEGSSYRLVTIIGLPDEVEWSKYLISVAMSGGEPSQALGNSVPPGMVKASQGGGGGGGGGGFGGQPQQPQYSVQQLQAAGYTPEQIATYVASQQQQQQQQRGQGQQQQQPLQVRPMPNGNEVVVNVPNEAVGGVIGRQGSKVNHIRQLSGAKVSIQDSAPGGTFRSVNVESDNQFSVATAQFLVQIAATGFDILRWQAQDVQRAMAQQAGAGGGMGMQQGMGGQMGMVQQQQMMHQHQQQHQQHQQHQQQMGFGGGGHYGGGGGGQQGFGGFGGGGGGGGGYGGGGGGGGGHYRGF